jgi:hypothetical protein
VIEVTTDPSFGTEGTRICLKIAQSGCFIGGLFHHKGKEGAIFIGDSLSLLWIPGIPRACKKLFNRWDQFALATRSIFVTTPNIPTRAPDNSKTCRRYIGERLACSVCEVGGGMLSLGQVVFDRLIMHPAWKWMGIVGTAFFLVSSCLSLHKALLLWRRVEMARTAALSNGSLGCVKSKLAVELSYRKRECLAKVVQLAMAILLSVGVFCSIPGLIPVVLGVLMVAVSTHSFFYKQRYLVPLENHCKTHEIS